MDGLPKPRAAIALAAAGMLCGGACPARALDVGPKDLPLTVAGVPVQIPVAGSIDVQTDADAIHVKASASGDLHAIQDHALAIARGLPLPRDPCAHKDFNIIVISIDPTETTAMAAEKKVEYLKMYAHPETADGWHFMTGTQANIDKIA